MADEKTLAVLTAPVRDWAATLGDPWLTRAVARRLDLGDLWNVAAAAALSGRLLPTEGPLRDRVMAALRAGAVDPQVARPRLWMAALSDGQVQELADLALAELHVLQEDVDTLRECEIAENKAFVLAEMCHRRDDLEAVRVLLRARMKVDTLDGGLAYLDPIAAEACDELPDLVLPFDERLARMARLGAEEWWVQPARLMEPAEHLQTAQQPQMVRETSPARVLKFPWKFDLPLFDMRSFAPVALAASPAGGGAGLNVVEESADGAVLRARLDAAGELFIDVRPSEDQAQAGLAVVLDYERDGVLVERFGPVLTDAAGTAAFGPRSQYPVVEPGTVAVVRVIAGA